MWILIVNFYVRGYFRFINVRVSIMGCVRLLVVKICIGDWFNRFRFNDRSGRIA
jgi:hypothetical protein